MARSYLGFDLRIKDSDLRHRWGGKVRRDVEGTLVADLQSDLKAVGFALGIDGGFGEESRDMLSRFQAALVAGAREKHDSAVIHDVAPLAVRQDGVADAPSAEALALLAESGQRLCGWLVRLPLSSLPNSKLGGGFKRLKHKDVGENDIVVDRAFAEPLRAMDAEAGRLGVTLSFNQTLRLPGVPVSGAVVTPSSFSQHFLGHAVDLNVIEGGTINTSALHAAGKWTPGAKALADFAVGLGLRWGAKFGPPDPVHFDLFVPPPRRGWSPETALWSAKFWLNQRQIGTDDPIAEG